MKESTKKKLRVVSGVVLLGGVGCLGYNVIKLKRDNDILMTAASEGLFEEALATTVRKLNSRKDRYSFLKAILNPTERDKATMKKLAREIRVLEIRKNHFIKVQMIVGIQDLD